MAKNYKKFKSKNKKTPLKKENQINQLKENKEENLQKLQTQSSTQQENIQQQTQDQRFQKKPNEQESSQRQKFKQGSFVFNKHSFISLMIGLLAIVGVFSFSLYIIPEVILQNTDEAIALRKKKESEKLAKEKQEKIQKQIEEENKVLKFEKQTIALNIENFGQLKIRMLEDIAPKSTENFIRLTHRGYYNNTVFHRMVKAENFNIIQGGSPDASSVGGESAFGTTIPDELWKVKPEFDPQTGALVNNPEFKSTNYYQDFNKETGQVTYPKGAVLMAKTPAPDSATSQFFINLTNTILPAQYTVFGMVTEDTLEVLDKIYQQVNPITTNTQQEEQNPLKDGKPDKELKITEAKILS